MKLLQINTTVNSGSTGRIAEDIGNVFIANGHKSYIAFGRGNRPSKSHLIKIGNQFDIYLHGIKTALFDRHGYGSKQATIQLIKEIEKINPDIIGLHNLHGYYLNIEILFSYILKKNIPVLWTLFDCWAFTGHCTYFDDINCEKYKTDCHNCPKIRKYPSSYIFDNSFKNFQKKRNHFSGLDNIEFVVHSNWLKEIFKSSFLKNYKIHCFPSGIDLNVFKPTISNLKSKYNLEGKKIIMGCASPWSERKGLNDFLELRSLLKKEIQIILVGLNNNQANNLSEGILGIQKTDSIEELAAWYSLADVFVNPTWQDNFPTTNIEALACGTPVITYNTGGSPEAIDETTGLVVAKGDVQGINKAIHQIISKGKSSFSTACRERAVRLYDKNDRYMDYLHLYEEMLVESSNKI